MRPLSDLPPENETVTLHFSHAALPGWMSRRFLRGTPTWWALIDGRAQLVEPIGWSHRLAPGEAILLCAASEGGSS